MTQTSCDCPSPSPQPSCSPSNTTITPKVAYYLGEYANIYPTGNVRIGALESIFLSSDEDFKIPFYSCKDLIDSGVLPKTPTSPDNFEYFTLTERELLAAHSFESWKDYLGDQLLFAIRFLNPSTNPGDQIELNDAKLDKIKKEFIYEPNKRSLSSTLTAPFGLKAAVALKILDEADSFAIVIEAVKQTIEAIKRGDPSSLGIVFDWLNLLIKPFSGSPYSDCIPSTNDTSYDKLKKFKQCWEWIHSIAENYYGKTFLLKIGNKPPMTDINVTTPFIPFKGVCVKRYDDGRWPVGDNGVAGNAFGGIFFVDGDGEAQGLTVSDQVSNDGGFPLKDHSVAPQTDINKIFDFNWTDLDWIKTEDGKILPFAKIGELADSSGCIKLYNKFGSKFFIDISKINSENYFLKKNYNNNIIVYMKCSVENRIYNINSDYISSYTDNLDNKQYSVTSIYQPYNGQWVLITLSDQIPYSSYIENNDVFSNIAAYLGWAKSTVNFPSSDKILVGKYYDVFRKTNKNYTDKITGLTGQILDAFGARNNLSQNNMIDYNDKVCIRPSGFVIPMQSNVYTYGSYWYDGLDSSASPPPDNSGGVDVVRYEVLAPWNFIPSGEEANPVTKAYETMDCIGASLAKDSSRGLQRVERGKITLSGLPILRKLGQSIDILSKFPNGDGPTLLTDISVDYGSGGFRTTYNFQSHTQRFGDTSKHILNAWTEAIKERQTLNETIRNNKKRINNIRSSRTISRFNDFFSGGDAEAGSPNSPVFLQDFTPHKLLISGYYFDTSSQNNYDDSPYSPSGSMSPSPDPSDLPFDPCIQPSPYPAPSSSGSPSDKRIYCFAETHEPYQHVVSQSTYRQLHIMSIDGLYLPVSLMGDLIFPSPVPAPPSPTSFNSGRIARFTLRQENNVDFKEWKDSDNINYDKYTAGFANPSKTRDEIPPFKMIGATSPKVYSLPINQQYLNPLLSSKLLEDWDTRKNDTIKGFVISSISFGQDATEFQLTHNDLGMGSNDLPKAGDNEVLRQAQDNFRFSALRGPLVIQGWGYDTSGKPIPNSADSPYNVERGRFTKFGLTDKFMKGWIENPRTWPVGPVDLRFDRERGVWTCPSPNKIVVARLKDKLKPYNKARAQLLNPEAGGIRYYQNYNITGPNGENIKLNLQNTIIMVYDFLGVELYANDVIYGYYDDNRYIVLESSRNYKDSDQDLEYKDFEEYPTTCTTTTTTTTTVTTTCDWCGLECLQDLPTYKGNVKQILGHDDKGCLIWLDTTTCCLCCDLGGTPIVVSNQSAGYLWDPVILDCPYADSPYPPNAAFELSAYEELDGNWTFAINLYCEETPDLIIIDGSNNFFTTPLGLLVGAGYGMPITTTDTPCLLGGTVDIVIDANGDATITINT